MICWPWNVFLSLWRKPMNRFWCKKLKKPSRRKFLQEKSLIVIDYPWKCYINKLKSFHLLFMTSIFRRQTSKAWTFVLPSRILDFFPRLHRKKPKEAFGSKNMAKRNKIQNCLFMSSASPRSTLIHWDDAKKRFRLFEYQLNWFFPQKKNPDNRCCQSI